MFIIQTLEVETIAPKEVNWMKDCVFCIVCVCVHACVYLITIISMFLSH